MKKNFAAPPQGFYLFPERGGTTFNITSQDITSTADGNKIFSSPYKNLFYKSNSSNMLNATGTYDYYYDPVTYQIYNSIVAEEQAQQAAQNQQNQSSGGGFFSGLNLASLLQTAGSIYANEQQIKLAEQQGKITADQAAKARAELAAAQANAQIAATQGQTTIDKIKAYAVPIAIIGVVGIAGIAAYFFFKKKKIQ